MRISRSAQRGGLATTTRRCVRQSNPGSCAAPQRTLWAGLQEAAHHSARSVIVASTISPDGIYAPGEDIVQPLPTSSSNKSSQSLDVTAKYKDMMVELTVTVPAQRCKESYEKIMAALRKDYDVPGFRNKDKVPYDFLIQAAGGEEKVHFACVEEIMNVTMEEAFEGVKEERIPDSVRVVSDGRTLVESFDPDQDFTYVVSSELGNMGLSFSRPYKGLKVEVDAVLNKATEEARMEQSIIKLLRDRGGNLRVAERAAQWGDTLIIDFRVVNRDTGEVVEGLEKEKHEVDCIAENNFLPGVMKQMMGMKVGEIQSFEFQFPDPWEPEELAGMMGMVQVKLREVLQWTLPELSLEICQSVKPEVQSKEEFMKHLREAVRLEGAEELQRRIQSDILEQLGQITQLEKIPPGTFEKFAMERYQARLQEGIENRVISEAQLKELTQKHVVEQYVQVNKNTLEGEFKAVVAVEHIFKAEGLQADEAELEEHLESRRKEFARQGRVISIDQVKQFMKSEFEQLATMQYLQDTADLKINPLPEGEIRL